MILLLALVLAALGLALIVFAILALRDDPPRWMLRVKRPGWFGVLGLVAVVTAFALNTSRHSFSDDVAAYIGRDANCEKLGVIETAAGQEDVYTCKSADDGSNLGCFARVEGDLVDVTRQEQAAGTRGC